MQRLEMSEATQGDGYAVSHLDAMGEGYGFRKVRHELGVTAFGVNAIVVPPSYETGRHYHDEQEELYFLHSGRMEIEFGDGTTHVLEPGGMARVDAATVRATRIIRSIERAVNRASLVAMRASRASPARSSSVMSTPLPTMRIGLSEPSRTATPRESIQR